MSNRTIAKFRGLVILLAAGAMLTSSCSHAKSTSRSEVDANEFSADYNKPTVVGRIQTDELTEASGLAASGCQPGVLWTHNDSGDGPFIYAVSSKGELLGTFQVENARNRDWEDIAAYKENGTCYLYIGDIGNNKLEKAEGTIYRVKEPTISADASSSDKKSPFKTEPATEESFKFPDTPHNAETLMVNPTTGDIYVLTKLMEGPSIVYKITPKFGDNNVVVATRVGEVSVPAVPNGLLTGGAIAPDGKSVVICDYSSGYELKLGSSTNFDEIWKQKPVPVNLGERKQGEAITYSADGSSIFATSEGKKPPLIEVKRK